MSNRSVSFFLIPLVMLLGFLWTSSGAPSVGAVDPREMLRLLDEMDSSYSRVNDYVGALHSQERIGRELGARQTALFKFQKPFKVYMNLTKGPSKGTHALYVDGSYGNKLLVKQGGLLGVLTLSLDPNGLLAMSGNRHPITELGFGFLLAEIRRNIEKAIRSEELEVMRLTTEIFNGRPATVVEGRILMHGDRKYYCSRFIIHIDKDLLLPVGNAFFDEKDEMFEEYVFTDVKINVGVTALDFSRNNKSYRFR